MKAAAAAITIALMYLSSADGGEVADKAAIVRPGQVHFSGWLSERVNANWKNRLLTVSLEERLRPFSIKNEAGGWSGEHIGKWLHASALAWQYAHDPALRKRMDEAVAALAAAQGPDGYLGTYTAAHRWTGWDVWCHKYNLIGLLAYHQCTGDQQALAAARKIGDLLINTFGEGKRDIIRAGEHVGMAATSVLEPVVLLYRETKDPRYLEFARYIVRAYDQPNGPQIVRSLTATHSVRRTANAKAYEMMSNLVGLCELYRSTGDASLLKPCIYAHDDIVANRMYLTGGTSLGEHFQDDHFLPNTGAVSENCAQVTWMQLALQLLRLTGEAKYADTLECVAYNHLLASQQPQGGKLCYFTPLAGKKPYDASMNCCTSSGPRGIALLPTFAYMLAPNAVRVNLYEDSTLEFDAGGAKVALRQKTRYPLDGKVEITIEPERPVEFELCCRIPAWCARYTVKVNGQPWPVTARGGGYLRLSQQWNKGDSLELDFAMPAVVVAGTHTNRGSFALRRGPLALTLDGRLNQGLSPGLVSPLVESDGTVRLAAVPDPASPASCTFRGEGFVPGTDADNPAALKKVPIVLPSFADAGQSGAEYVVWFPMKERLAKATAAPFRLCQESCSRQGNVNGSIADGDATTFRVTYDGARRGEDWFAVERPSPVTINSVTYAHGRTFHDGGWWDASHGQPRIQVKRTASADWEDVGRIESYPPTTAADNKRIADGAEFTVRFRPLAAVGIRVIGVPACGDNHKQNFASCADLQGSFEKEPSKP
jgi:uncharacterized protein